MSMVVDFAILPSNRRISAAAQELCPGARALEGESGILMV
jgi:hypothetical protein